MVKKKSYVTYMHVQTASYELHARQISLLKYKHLLTTIEINFFLPRRKREIASYVYI
jgi:hypothetical protein